MRLKKIFSFIKNNAVNLNTKDKKVAQRFHKIIVVLLLFCFPFCGWAQNKSMQQVVARQQYEIAKWNARFMPQYAKTTALHLNEHTFSFSNKKKVNKNFLQSLSPFLFIFNRRDDFFDDFDLAACFFNGVLGCFRRF